MCDRASFIECNGFEATEIFEMHAAFYQDAITRSLSDARKNGSRRAKREGARRRGDKQSHCAQKRFAEWKTKQGRQDDDQPSDNQHGGNKDALEFFNRLLRGRFLRLRLGHQIHHARQRALACQLGHLDNERALAVDRSGEDLVARLFVHRDAERVSPSMRQREIESSWPDSPPKAVLICVIPVRMTEAWLIANELPIRSAVGNPNGVEQLGLPAVKDIETLPDPKELLFSALKAASGLNASRKRRLNPHTYRHRVSELTNDLAPLRQLPSFRHLEAQVLKHLKAFNS